MKILIIVLLLISIVSSKIYFVSNLGNDNNIGSNSEPFLTLKKAVDVAVDGDNIKIFPGLYRGDLNFPNITKSLKIEGHLDQITVFFG
jgi:hypothetical protein